MRGAWNNNRSSGLSLTNLEPRGVSRESSRGISEPTRVISGPNRSRSRGNFLNAQEARIAAERAHIAAQKATENAAMRAREAAARLSDLRSKMPFFEGVFSYVVLSVVMAFVIVVASNDIITDKNKLSTTKYLNIAMLGVSSLALAYSMYIIHRNAPNKFMLSAFIVGIALLGFLIPIIVFRVKKPENS
jgi:hypothetical protein